MSSIWLHRFAKVVTSAAFLLIVAGGLVTSTGSGLAVPDWPLSYGTLFPPMIGGIRFEHTHRLIAGLVALLTLALTLWIHLKEERKWIRVLGLAAFLAVLTQAVLGGLTVIFLLPAFVSILHACLAQTFFCLLIALSLFTSRDWRDRKEAACSEPALIRTLALATTGAVYLQLIAGAVVRHTQGGGIGLHIGGAFLVLGLALALVRAVSDRLAQEKKFLRPALVLGLLVLVQIFLGLGAFAATRLAASGAELHLGSILVRTAHQAVSVLILGTSFFLALLSFRLTGESGSSRTIPAVERPRPLGLEPVSCYLALTKPRLTILSVLTVLVGFYLASPACLNFVLLVNTLWGACLLGAGVNALNQFFERDTDAKMKRTESRPVPSGKLTVEQAFNFGLALSVVGILHLAFFVHPRTSLVALLVFATYLFFYTPLKMRTRLAVLVGAIPGALPPVLGWSAVRRVWELEAWTLFAIVFLWQIPHFAALAWLFREDYGRAGFPVLAVEDETGVKTSREIVAYSLFLLLVSLLPYFLGLVGPLYLSLAVLLGLSLLGISLTRRFLSPAAYAKRFFLSSITYLFLIVISMMVDKT